MAICTPKRVFTEVSIANWRPRLGVGWEGWFSKEELSLGKEIYRNGEIREIEVGEKAIVVHAKFDQEDCYSTIEWVGEKAVVKSSSKDKVLVRALAVAGMYEARGIVEDMNEGKETDGRVKAVGASKLGRLDVLKKLAGERKVVQQVESVSRKLVLKFMMVDEGLAFQSLWEGKDGVYKDAFKGEKNSLLELSQGEREKIIYLSSQARKLGFKFRQSDGTYLLSEIGKIQEFLRSELGKWEGKFEMEIEDGVERLGEDAQEAELVMEVDTSGEGTFEFRWGLFLDDEEVDGRYAKELIRQVGKPVVVPGYGLGILSEEKVELLGVWKRWMDLYPEGGIPRYVLFSLFEEEPVKLVMSSEIKKWRESLYKYNGGGMEVPQFLRPYQQQGVKWMWHLCEQHCHGLLADEMGLGKTLQVLSLIHSRRVGVNMPNLIVCPASVVPVWVKEVERFFPDTEVQVLKSGNDFFKCQRGVLWVASYAQLRMHQFLLDSTEFGYVILDEAQLIKNPEAKVSQACMRIRGRHRIVLTGTPLENKYLDLWTLFRFLMPGLLGSRKRFEDRIEEDKEGFLERLRKQVAPFVLRRTKKDVLKELPDKTEMECVCPLTEVQRSEYLRLSTEGIKVLGNDLPKAVKESSLNFLTLLTRLRQVCCDPGLLPWMTSGREASGKITMLMEKLEEILANGHKVVVFSQFISFLDRIKGAIVKEFPEVPIFELTGKTLERAKPVEQFQKHKEAGVMLVSLRAGGTGVTLNTADYLFLMDPWWNPAVEEQAIDRVHRIGQDKPVFVYRMVTAGTVEARIQKLKSHKKGIFMDILGGMRDISDVRNYFETLSALIELLPEEGK